MCVLKCFPNYETNQALTWSSDNRTYHLVKLSEVVGITQIEVQVEVEKLTSLLVFLKPNFNRENYQAKLLIGECQHDTVVNVVLPCPKGGMLLVTLLGLVWSTLPAVPSTCLELVA